MEKRDYLVRATAADGMIRAFAALTTETVEAARQAHNTSPVATAALGRLLTGAVMMGVDMKNDDDLVTIRINCDGPIGGLLATADRNGHVKGYVHDPSVMLPATESGKLDVGGAVGQGIMTVIKDIGLKEPYVGETNLVSGEIAEDLTYYYAVSEQIPCSVALGVLMKKNNTVNKAGGLMIQLMPGCSDEIAQQLEERVKAMDAITTMLDTGMGPEDILKLILGDMDLDIKDEKTYVSFTCSCDRDRVRKALISTGKQELEEMAAEKKNVELCCQFCGKKYEFTPEEIEEMIKSI